MTDIEDTPVYGEGSRSSRDSSNIVPGSRSASSKGGGGGSGTPSVSAGRGVSQSVQESTHRLTPQKTSTGDSTETLHEAVVEWLTERGICSLDRKLRTNLASRLIAEGANVEALEFIGETIERRSLQAGKTLDQVASFIGKALHTPMLWMNYTEDAGAFERWRREREAELAAEKAAKAPSPSVPLNYMPPQAQEAEWDRQEKCRRVWCQLVYDRNPVGDVAARERITASEVVSMAREGMLLSGGDEESGEHDLKMATDPDYKRKVMDAKIAKMAGRAAKSRKARAEKLKKAEFRAATRDEEVLIREMRARGAQILDIQRETGLAGPVVLDVVYDRSDPSDPQTAPDSPYGKRAEDFGDEGSIEP